MCTDRTTHVVSMESSRLHLVRFSFDFEIRVAGIEFELTFAPSGGSNDTIRCCWCGGDIENSAARELFFPPVHWVLKKKQKIISHFITRTKKIILMIITLNTVLKTTTTAYASNVIPAGEIVRLLLRAYLSLHIARK